MKRSSTKIFIDEIFSKPPKKHYPTKKTITISIDDTWIMDILDLIDCGPKNKRGYIFVLVVIDIFSKFGGTFPLRKKCSLRN